MSAELAQLNDGGKKHGELTARCRKRDGWVAALLWRGASTASDLGRKGATADESGVSCSRVAAAVEAFRYIGSTVEVVARVPQSD